MLGFTITRNKKEDETDVKKDATTSVRKKKEPAKPWGKAERVIVFGLFGSTILIASILALSARSWKLSGISFEFLPDLSFHRTYVLEKPTNEDFEVPISQFKNLVADKSGVYSFFVARVYRDSSYGWRQYDEFESDSLVQMALIWEVFKSGSRGDIALSKDYVIGRADKTGNTSLRQYATGSTLSYKELAGMLCSGTDSAVERVFVDALGGETLQNTLHNNLSLSTNIDKHKTTASDIGFMLKRIVESEMLSSDVKDDFVDCLRKADNKEFEGVFADQFVYKYDIDTKQASVAGIVFAPKPYVVVIAGEGVVESEAREALTAVLKIIADFEI